MSHADPAHARGVNRLGLLSSPVSSPVGPRALAVRARKRPEASMMTPDRHAMALLPEPRSHRVAVQGGELHVGVWPGADPVVLAIHGGTSTHRIWAPIVR